MAVKKRKKRVFLASCWKRRKLWTFKMKALYHNDFKDEPACVLNLRKMLSAQSGKTKEHLKVILWKICKGHSFRHFLAVTHFSAYSFLHTFPLYSKNHTCSPVVILLLSLESWAWTCTVSIFKKKKTLAFPTHLVSLTACDRAYSPRDILMMYVVWP